MTTPSEWELIQRCRQGATSAFEPLVRTHQGPALGYATALLGDADEAADALQDAFIQAYRSLDRLRPGSAFGPWFRTILRNICLDRLRSPRLSRRVALDAESAEVVHSGEHGVERAAANSALHDVLAGALALIPHEQRVVILLREVEGLSYAEISAQLGVPAGTVASRLNHARAALRKMLVARGVGLEELT